jgi:hypothetical protein
VTAFAVPRRRSIDVHLPLAVAAATTVAAGSHPLADSIVAAGALAVTWSRRDELLPLPLLALAGAFALAQIFVSLARGAHGDLDPRVVYDPEGQALLHGTFPHSPYPVGAVVLFALEGLLGGSLHQANALLMVPFQVLVVAALVRRPWVAAAIAIWPANAFFWQFRFDLVPAAAIAVGVALAHRERWHAAGWVLGLGAAVKWTPALTAISLVAWLLARHRTRDALRHAAGTAAALLLANVPVFVLAFTAAAAPYRAQAVRGITGESLPYLPLRLLGIAQPPHHYYGEAAVPGWTDTAAGLCQLLAVGALVVLAARAALAETAFARAALAPAAFLLSNRVFSPQFFVVILVCCACAIRKRVLIPAALLAVATTANALLFPGLTGAASSTWTPVSALALLPAAAAVAVLAR